MPKKEKKNRPTDFNDLHCIEGLEAVKQQITAALKGATVHSFASPAPPDQVRPTLVQILERYAFVMPDASVWDSHDKKVIKKTAFRSFLGPELFRDWEKSEKRRSVKLEDVQRIQRAAAPSGVGGLALALERYVYLNPSSQVWDREKREVVPIADLRFAIASCFSDWLKSPHRKEIAKENLVFDPTQTVSPDTHINMFRGLPMVPEYNDDKCRHMRAMLWHLCNEDDAVFVWLKKWLAYPLVHLGAKMQTAVLMHSDVHGSGKSFFFDGVLREIYGSYFRTYGQQQLESQYNDWISQTLFGLFEEVLSRQQKYSHTGTIKQMVTGSKFYVEKKYLSGWEESNHMNCVFLSNEVQPLPIEPSDRRFLVVWPKTKLMQELQSGVDAELANGGATAFYGWLLQTDLTDFTPYTEPPQTEAKERIIDFGRPAWEVFLMEWQNEELGEDAPYLTCQVKDLFKVFERWCTERKEHCMGMSKFSSFVASKIRRRKDVHYDWGLTKGKGNFFVVGQPPAGKNQMQYFGECVDKWETIANKRLNNDQK